MFKVIVARSAGSFHTGAYIIPNIEFFDADLEGISVPVNEIESSLGLELLPEMPITERKMLDHRIAQNAPFYPKRKRMKKMIKRIQSLGDLELVWSSLSEELKVELTNVYDDKMKHLQDKASLQTTTAKPYYNL